MQGKKPFDTFGLTPNPIQSEEGLRVVPDYTLDQLEIEQYDGLLLPGTLDVEPLATILGYAAFVRRFDRPDINIAAISSGSVLLARAGLLRSRRFMTGVPKEHLAELGFEPDNYVREGKILRSGNILTAQGHGFVNFGVEFGIMLGLSFSPAWYGR
jgi:transcriptional regulator GlxA family with amidase domain